MSLLHDTPQYPGVASKLWLQLLVWMQREPRDAQPAATPATARALRGMPTEETEPSWREEDRR